VAFMMRSDLCCVVVLRQPQMHQVGRQSVLALRLLTADRASWARRR
jgi:hypothetical protein